MCLVLFLLLIFLIFFFSTRENLIPLTVAYPSKICEFNSECLDDERRQCQMSSGLPGKCVLYGKCCNEFMNSDAANPSIIRAWGQPYDLDDCSKFCNIYPNNFNSNEECMKFCENWFHPYFR